MQTERKGRKLIRVLKPSSPVMRGVSKKIAEVVYAKNQPQYLPLPAVVNKDKVATTRWHMCWRDRLLVLLYGDIYIETMTFGKPFQPLRVRVKQPAIEEVL